MKNAHIDIANWLNGEKNYQTGVLLYMQYGKSPTFKKIITKRETKANHEKLIYLLRKISGWTPEELSNANKEVKKTQEKYQKDKDLIVKKGKLYNKRAVLFKKMQEIPPTNTPKHNKARVELKKRIDLYTKEIDNIYKTINSAKKVENTQKQKKASVLTEETYVYGFLKQNGAQLKQRLNNLRASYSKDKTKVFGNVDKKIEPMPEGKKRDEIMLRIAAKEKEMHALIDYLAQLQ